MADLLKQALDALDAAESSLVDYCQDVPWGQYDADNLAQVRRVIQAISDHLKRDPRQAAPTAPAEPQPVSQSGRNLLDEFLDEAAKAGVTHLRLDVSKMWPEAAPQAEPQPLIARQLGEWNEDDGHVTWWAWNGHGWAGEAPWIGSPLCDDWPGYHTHWTPAPSLPGIGTAPKEPTP